MGTVVSESNKIININDISSLNIRIAREIFGASRKVLKHVFNYKENNIYNTLLISPPGARKDYDIKRLSEKYK